jgi:hypothetical protein
VHGNEGLGRVDTVGINENNGSEEAVKEPGRTWIYLLERQGKKKQGNTTLCF